MPAYSNLRGWLRDLRACMQAGDGSEGAKLLEGVYDTLEVVLDELDSPEEGPVDGVEDSTRDLADGSSGEGHSDVSIAGELVLAGPGTPYGSVGTVGPGVHRGDNQGQVPRTDLGASSGAHGATGRRLSDSEFAQECRARGLASPNRLVGGRNAS